MSNNIIEPDLPIIPCYTGEGCGTICNEKEPKDGQCVMGNDANYCSGILNTCNSDLFDCNTNTNNPAEADCPNCLLGCNININEGVQENCLEFSRKNDVFTGCDDICWNLGGNKEINQKCGDMFKGKLSCNSMRYFCKWNNDKNLCETDMEKSPRDNYINTFGTLPPKSPTIINIKENCLGDDRDPNCIQIESPLPENEEWKLKCSQSSWSSEKRTSYAKNAYICCLEKCNKETGECTKDCLTTPRCQFVEETCDCCSKEIDGEDNFICAMVQNNNLEKGFGYCTWCNGQCDKKRTNIVWNNSSRVSDNSNSNNIPIYAHQGQEGDEWNDQNGDCKNRCANFNLCEADNSEILWNKCIWEESEHRLGVDPNKVASIQDVRIKSEKGTPLCVKDNCRDCDFEKEIMNKCRETIFPKSFNKSDVLNPSKTTIDRCNSSGDWINMCIYTKNSQILNSGPESINFFCEFCPSLKCTNSSGEPVQSSLECRKNCDPTFTSTESPKDNTLQGINQIVKKGLIIGFSILGGIILLVLMILFIPKK